MGGQQIHMAKKHPKERAQRSDQGLAREPLGLERSVHYAGVPQYLTYAATESLRQEPESGVPLPSRRNIQEAKDWVDDNEK